MAEPVVRSDEASSPLAGVAARAARIPGLVALTNDALLVRALQELATTGTNVSVVTDLHALTDELLQNAGDKVLIDTAALDAPATEVVDLISRQLPDLCLMVAGHSTDQQQLASRLANRKVFRFVHKPASPQRLRLILDAAARTDAPVAAVEAPATPKATPRTATPGGHRIPRNALFAALAALVAVAVATWLMWPDSAPPAVAAVPAPAPLTPPTQEQSSALLARADAALAAGRFVATDGSSAAELYRAVLKTDAASRRAQEGFDRSIDQALRRAEESLLAGRLNDAGTLVAAVALISPENPRLGFLNTQISREQARINTDANQRRSFEARQATIRAALATMQERLQRGALLDPASASAVASFREAEAIGANDTAVHAARETLVAALLTAADSELSARRPPAARRLVDAARSINSSAPGIDVLVRRVDEVGAQLAASEAPAPPRAESPPPPPAAAVAPAPAPVAVPAAPATPAATAAPAAGDVVVPARSLKLLRSEEPRYPEWALQQLISGWVEMEFTVATDGSVKNIKVIAADPKTTFNSAATTALSRYRFAPVLRDGVPVAQRASIRMRFMAQDSK